MQQEQVRQNKNKVYNFPSQYSRSNVCLLYKGPSDKWAFGPGKETITLAGVFCQ